MTTIQIMSDLHLEFFGGDKYGIESFLQSLNSDADILLLAGDIFGYIWLDLQMENISKVFSNKRVIFIPGNHEYYKSSKEDMDIILKEETKKYENMTFLENDYTFLDDDTVLVGACGWNDEFDVVGADMMNDFVLIRELIESRHLSMDWNKESKEYFRETMSHFKGKKRIICMTHNSPLLDFIPLKYVGTPLNPFFANDWSDLVQEFEPNIWISGHFHQMIKFKKYNTLFIENGHGYINNQPVKEFIKKMVINI